MAKALHTVRNHIEIVESAGGTKARIVGHRICVQDIVIRHGRMGCTPDDIVDQFPTITLADVHAALAYYWDNREEIDRAIAEEDALFEQLSAAHVGPLKERLSRPTVV
jgi:uncharacterized protein (DUF433 family)